MASQSPDFDPELAAVLAARGWALAETKIGDGSTGGLGHGYCLGPLAIVALPEGAYRVLLPKTGQEIGDLPGARAALSFAERVAGDARAEKAEDDHFAATLQQQLLDCIDEEYALARDAAAGLESQIADLLESADSLKAKAILFARDDD